METEIVSLSGTRKQIPWAEKIRAARLRFIWVDRLAFSSRIASEEESSEIIKFLRNISSAHWWIETRMLDRDNFLRAAIDACFKARYAIPDEDDTMATAVLDEALLAPSKIRGPIAEVSLAVKKVRVVLIEFNEDTNTLLKKYGFRWEAPAWTRQVSDDLAGHRAVEIALQLLAHGCPVRIFDEALRLRTVNHDYEPESPRSVEVSIHEKYSTKFHLVWSRDEKPEQCQKAAKQLRGAKVFDDGAYVALCHFEEIQDFAIQNGFTITPEAQSLMDNEKGKLSGAVKVAARPKAGVVTAHKPELAPANGEIDAELLDD